MNILKTIYNISKDDSLIIVKIDKKTEDLFSTYVKYEIYHPYNLSQLDLNFCKEITIIICQLIYIQILYLYIIV